MTVKVQLLPYRLESILEDQSPHITTEREESSRKALQDYKEDLACRFNDGGDYDTYKIATGEIFVEIVCGGYMNGYMPVRCYEPLTAVQLFIDAMERYFETVPQGHTLHWRTRPEWKKHIIEEIDRWYRGQKGYEEYHVPRVVYSIYARLVLV